ncbi:MAG: acyloxyacyl hydrolase [Steroidobacteraceae bacterium]
MARAHFQTAGRTAGSGARSAALILIASLWIATPRFSAAASSAKHHQALCGGCRLFVGAGESFSTYGIWHWTGGLVLPAILEIDDSRWELGAFRFATRQRLEERQFPADTLGAQPYWGFSAMRRWQILHRGSARLYLGFGGGYRTETDLLVGTKWTFAFLLAIRFDLGNRAIELSARHWSNAWIRLPDRGQNFVTISFSF